MNKTGIIVIVIVIIAAVVGYVVYSQSQGGNGSEESTKPSTAPVEVDNEMAEYIKSLDLSGAGASFPAPIYNKWSQMYEEEFGMQLNYDSIGSGGGIRQIKAKTVMFGASDKPLMSEELDEAGLIQFPMIIGGVVPVYNIPGIKAGEIKLDADTLAGIFLGDITKWNDEAIMALNKGLELPDMNITVVHRSDGSGTTWIFTNYLTKVSKKWADKIGNHKSLEWPVGVGGKGNEGIANNVKQTEGGIGYVEYAYALQNNLSYVMLKNKSGNFAAPTSEAFQAAAASADWTNAPGYYIVLTDQPGDETWPIVGASFILIYKEQQDMMKTKAMLTYFDWCYKNGQKEAMELDYVPIPLSVVEMVEKTWADEVKVDDEAVWK